ncbi:MAG: hypothetical protein Q8Q18_01240 [bacterium]|nr:hypothetical protein [bacterium]
MKYYELTKEEEKLLKASESGALKRFPAKEQQRLTNLVRSAARSSLERTKNINIRLSERDVLKLKARAAEQGIPYQTLVASIIHQSNSTAS